MKDKRHAHSLEGGFLLGHVLIRQFIEPALRAVVGEKLIHLLKEYRIVFVQTDRPRFLADRFQDGTCLVLVFFPELINGNLVIDKGVGLALDHF